MMLVEDDSADADRINRYLRSVGYNPAPVHVSTLSAALTALGKMPIDAILLDLHLPDATGVSCVEAIRAVGDGVAIVVLTGVEDEGLALACLRAGAQDYLPKDKIDRQMLRRAIGYALARSDEQAARRRADLLQRRLAAIVTSTTDGIVSTTADGRIDSWNRGAERIFGIAEGDAVGHRISELVQCYADGDDRTESMVELIVRAPSTSRTERAVVYHPTGGAPAVHLSVVSFPLPDVDDDVAGHAAIFRDVTDAWLRDRELTARNAELVARDGQMRALAERLTEVREDERTRLSREVHDNLGQLLTGIKMDLRWIGRRLQADALQEVEGIRNRIQEADALVDETITTVQRIALELRPTVLDALGLPAAIRDESRRFSTRTGIPVRLDVPGQWVLDRRLATALFRILQELLTNIARHAHARTVRIKLAHQGREVVLRVEDDGVGIESTTAGAAKTAGLGLLGMQERAVALGGRLSVGSRPTGGTLAEAVFPVTNGVHA